MKIRNTGKSYARTKASDTELIVAHLSEQITLMQEKLDELSDTQIKVLEDSKLDLNEKLLEKAAGLIFRTKSSWQ